MLNFHAPARPVRSPSGRGAQGGVSLIEVLVSILILSFGVLAMAAMMSVAARYNKTTELRSVATLLVNDMADRMRANRAGATATTPGYDLKPTAYTALSGATTVPNTCSPGCTAAELAANDLAEWQTSLFYGLPGAAGYSSYDATTHSVDLWVAWRDPNADSGQPAASTECPTEFRTGGAGYVAPRCIYFRVGL